MDKLDRKTSAEQDDSLTAAVGDGLRSMAYSAVQRPYNAIQQLTGHMLHLRTPDLNLVSAPESAPMGSKRWFATTIGSGLGMLPELIAANKLARAGLGQLGMTAESVGLAGRISLAEAGLTGATYSMLFQPTEGHGNFWAEKARNSAIGYGTFAAAGAVNNLMQPLAGSFASSLADSGFSQTFARRGIGSVLGMTSGFAGGVVNAELNNFTGGHYENPLQAGITFGTAGFALGAATRFGLRAEREAPNNARSELTEEARPPVMSKPNDNGPIKSPSPWFGPKPEELASTVEAARTRYGESSPEHASTLLQLGDSHMVQGSTAHGEALSAYQRALNIAAKLDDKSSLTAAAYDKLSTLKQAQGDYQGAHQDLSKAIAIWEGSKDSNGGVDQNYFNRRQEDWSNMGRSLERQNRPIPQPPKGSG